MTKLGSAITKSTVAHVPASGRAIYGDIFITNYRLIFESHDGASVEKYLHSNVTKTVGRNQGFLRVGYLEIQPFGIHGTYGVGKGKEVSDYLNQKYYNSQAKLQRLINEANEREKHLDYHRAIEIYEKIEKPEEAARVRKLKADLAAPKTEIHGDYVDDRDTIVKDSVVNRSNIGAGRKSKAERLREAKALLDDGIIDSDEFKQMKQEILGKKVKKIIKKTKKEILGK